jgi:hypothetical protein
MMFDSGIPLGPGLLATWVPLPDPPTKNAKARINKAAIATSIPAFVLPLRSLFGTRFSFVSSDCLRLISATSIVHFDGSGFLPIVGGVAGERGLARLRRDQRQHHADQSKRTPPYDQQTVKRGWQASQIRGRRT